MAFNLVFIYNDVSMNLVRFFVNISIYNSSFKPLIKVYSIIMSYIGGKLIERQSYSSIYLCNIHVYIMLKNWYKTFFDNELLNHLPI